MSLIGDLVSSLVVCETGELRAFDLRMKRWAQRLEANMVRLVGWLVVKQDDREHFLQKRWEKTKEKWKHLM